MLEIFARTSLRSFWIPFMLSWQPITSQQWVHIVKQLFAEGEVLIGEYSPRRSRPIITEPEANNCFSINTQAINSKKRKKKHFNAKSSSLTVAKRLLAAILSVEVIIG